ncbi:MAG: hypothetical protein QOJ07_2072 [Thermoleophilaceae bacterium]|jgi:uncharacterized protein YndB with AHSA1/START domain|nr:hypothetical protein [Thermoleophilaceae bacterium]
MPTADYIEREVVLPVAPEEAWDALVRPEELVAWLADEVECEGPLDEGSEALLRWHDGDVRHAVVEDADEPRRLAFRWSGDGDDEETLVELTLEEVPGGTRLRVVESGFRALSVEARTLRSQPAVGWGPRLAACSAHASALARC